MTVAGEIPPSKSIASTNGIYSTETKIARGILALNQMRGIRIHFEFAKAGSTWQAQPELEVANV